MKVSRIAFFAALLFVLQVTAGTVVTMVLGFEDLSSLVVPQYIANTVVSICVFAYMSWAFHTKPYLMALLVGFLAALFGVISSALLIGDLSWWDPSNLVLDIPALLVAVLLGTSLGARFHRRGVANLE